MATFGSSIINKSGKKFAPKAGPRRSTSTPQAVAQTSSRASIERRTPSVALNPIIDEQSSADPQPSAIHAPGVARPDTRQDDETSRGLNSVNATRVPKSAASQPTNSSQGRKEDSRVSANTPESSIGSGQVQNSRKRSFEQRTSLPDNAASTLQSLTRRSPRAHKSALASSDTERPSRKRQRPGDPETEQIITSIGSPRRSLQQPLSHQSRQASETGGLVSERNDSNGAAEDTRIRLRTPPATINSSAHDYEKQSAVGGLSKTARRGAPTKGHKSDSRDSGRRGGLSKAAELLQSDPQASDHPDLENDISDTLSGPDKDDIEHSTTKRRRRRRARTPEESEKIEIATAVVKMSELCRDLGTGKKSKRAEEIEALDWTEVVRKQQERRARQEASELPVQESIEEAPGRVRDEEDVSVSLQLQQGPQMRLVNGQLVVDDASLQVDRHAAAAQSTMNFEEIEESELTRRVNSGTWMKREKTEVWTDEDISLLYQGLRMFGTDFEIISKMFPLRSRRQIKLRYNKEERISPNRVKQALSGKTTEMNLEVYSRLTDVTYEDPAIFNAEMERKRLEHDLEQKQLDEERAEEARKKREENETSVEPDEEDGRNGDSQKENDVQSIVAPAPSSTKPKKSKRRAKKPAVSKASKKSQHSRKIAGEAEVLGPVE